MSETDAPGRFSSRLVQHQHILKYLLIGGTATAVDVLIFMVMFNAVGSSELIAQSVSVPASVVFSFVVNAHHNFKTSDRLWLRLASFCIVALIGFFVGYGVIHALNTAGISPNIGKIASLPFVFVIQYVLNSKITFRKTTVAGN